MQTGRISSNFSVGGVSFTGAIARAAEGGIPQIVDIAAGVAGAISAAGVDGLASGHGIEQGDLIDLHWTDPADGSHKCRRGITVDTADANAITFDNDPAAEGDALPAEDTAVVVGVQTDIHLSFDGDALEILAIKCNQRAVADVRSAAASLVAAKLPAGEAWSWVSGQNVANPTAGETVGVIRVSNGSTSDARIYVGVLYQSVE